MLPNFLIIGAARAGTTSLYEYMRQHPQIFFSANKEPMFFALQDEKVDFKGPGDSDEINRKSITNRKDYEELFAAASGRPAVGEASALYLYSEKAANNIQHSIPDAKLIVILRNPIERAYSSFLYTIRDNRESLRDFAAALAAEPQRIAQGWEHIWHYKTMGFYGAQLQRYYDRFERKQIKVFLHEDLVTDLAGVLRETFEFLGVDPDFKPDLSLKYNQGGMPKRAWLNTLLTRPSRIKSWLKPLTPRFLIKYYTKLKHSNLDKPALSASARQQLIDAYRDDIGKLQELLGRDLSGWLKP